MTDCWLCVVLLSSGCMSLDCRSLFLSLSPHTSAPYSLSPEARLWSPWILIHCSATECAQHRSENIWQALFIDPAGGQAKSTATRSSLFWSRVPQKSPQQKGAAKPGGQEHNLAMVGFFFFVIERWWQLWVGKAVVECTNESDTFDCKEKQKKWKCTRIHRCVLLLASVPLPWSCADIHTTLVRIYTMYRMHVLMMRTVCVPAHAIWLTFRCYALLKMNHTHQQHESVIWGRSAWWTDLLQASCVILRIGTQVERRDRWIMKSNLGACCPLSPPWLCKSEKESANTQGLRRGTVSPSLLRSTVETCARLI